MDSGLSVVPPCMLTRDYRTLNASSAFAFMLQPEVLAPLRIDFLVAGRFALPCNIRRIISESKS